MGVNKSIFGSTGEARGFHSIEQTWGDRYRLFSNIPFSVLFEPEREWQNTSNFFFKTSIDYVLCTDAGKPLIAIDFDGLGGGFDKDGRYLQVNNTSDPHRKIKFDFKLKYAQRNDFPYHIVASDEFQNLDDDIALTVVDGIIGNWLATKDFEERAQSVLDEHADKIGGVPVGERREDIDDLLFDEEYDTHVKHNPILSRCLETIHQISAASDDDTSFIGGRSIPIEVADGWVSREHTISHKGMGKVSARAVLRDSSWVHSIIVEIAKLLAYSKLLRLLQAQQSTA